MPRSFLARPRAKAPPSFHRARTFIARTERALRCALLVALSLACLGVLPHRAHAIGFDLVPPGARDVGRGGASVVGADSAIGLFYNPATLLAPTTFNDSALSLHLGFTDICYRGVAVVEDAAGSRSAGQAYPEICSDAKNAYIPAGASTFRFGTRQRFAVSLGFYAPPTVGRNVEYGNAVTGTVDGGVMSALTPSRYMLMQEDIVQAFPTLGMAYQPHRQVRLGASFGWGITTFDFTTAAYSSIIAAQVPLQVRARSDISTQVEGSDNFVPRVQLGLWTQPVASIPLELAASFVWTQDVESSSAKLRLRNLRTTYEPALPLDQPMIDARVRNVSLKVPQLSTLTAGLRYAKKLDKPVGRMGGRLATERFDVEADLIVSFGKNVDRFVVGLPPTTVQVPSVSPLQPNGTSLQLPTRIALEHNWQTQFGLKLGGDYNVIPGLLALRAGYSYESDGVSEGYHQLDFLPLRRYGLYAGATVRVLDWVDVSASYAYFIVPDVTNSVSDAAIRRNVSGEPMGNEAAIANAGRFTQDASALVLELGMHL